MNIQPLIDNILREVDRHAIPGRPGAYCRFPGGDVNAYGCADAANIWYTLGHFPRDLEFRAACVAEIQKFQDPETGLFHEGTHVPYHSTAHCSAALELFDAAPLYPFKEFEQYRTPEGIRRFVASLPWVGDPNLHGHEGAGAFAAMYVTGFRDPAWQDAYFTWLTENCDPDYGLSVKGVVNVRRSAAIHLFNWFHYLFNFHACNRPFPYPEKLIDTCLDLFRRQDFPPEFNTHCGFWEVDWIFCINRASRQTKHRFAEVRQALREERTILLDFLTSRPDIADLPRGNDLHMLFGTISALAELQLALPGEMATDIALRNVLDRRPFI